MTIKHAVLDEGTQRSLGRGFSRRGILAALAGLGLAAPFGIAEAKRGRVQKKRRDRRQAAAEAAPQNICGDGSSPCLFPGFPPAGACDFPVNVYLSGKFSFRELPGGRFIVNSPNQRAIVENGNDPSKRATLNITGSGHMTIGPDGYQYWVATGSNLLFDPVDEPLFALTQGRFTYVLDATDPNNIITVVPRAGSGSLTDVCALIA